MTNILKSVSRSMMFWGMVLVGFVWWTSISAAATNNSQPENLDPLGILGEDNSGANSLPIEDELSLEDPKPQVSKQEPPKEEVVKKEEEVKKIPQPIVETPPSVTEPVPVEVPAPIERIAPPVEIAAPVAPPIESPATEPSHYSGRDKPNLRLEKKLFNIYKKFNSQPTNVEAWDQVVGARRSESYRVQKGDTLWDLSQTFFGDPNFWPKVWAINKEEVLNPHQVDPRMTIRFFPGSLTEAPTLGILTNEKVNDPYQEPQSLAAVEPNQSTNFVRGPEELPGRPVGKIPQSLPVYRMGRVHTAPIKYDLTDLVPSGGIGGAPIHYMMLDNVPSTVGWVQEAELGGNSAFDFQYVFVKLKSGRRRILTVVRAKEKFGGGTLVEVQGEIEVIDQVSEKNQLYRALVRKSINMIQVGSDLLEGPMARFDVSEGQEAKTSAPVKILGGVFGNRVSIFGRNSYVFLNSGKAQGVDVGKILPIFKNQAAHVKATTVEMLPGQIGKIKIISADQNHSTGFVINNLELIRRGDWVGFPGITISENSATSTVSRQDTAENLDSDFNEAFEKTFGDEDNQVKSDQVKSDQVKSDQVKSDQVKADQVKADQVKADQDRESPEGESKTSEPSDELQL